MDIEQFKKLLAEGKTEEAQKMFSVFLEGEISEREQGRVLIALASMHMEAQNTLNQEYIRVLKNAMAELSDLQKQHTNVTDAINLVKARKQLEE